MLFRLKKESLPDSESEKRLINKLI